MNRNRIVCIFLLIASFAIGVFLRTYLYTDRIALENDNSRDAQVAQYAADHDKIPQIGQYSSAGPFFYSPWWYWFLSVLARFSLGNLTLWYFSSLFSFVFLYLLYRLGKMVEGNILAVLMVAIAAASPAQLSIALSIWNPSIVAYLSLFSLIVFLMFIKRQRLIYFASTVFFVSLSINIHLQSLLMLPLLLFLLIRTRFSMKYIGTMILAFILPFTPLILFDLHHNWSNFSNFIYYIRIDQYNIYVPNRWLTYIFSYWPKTWADMLGVPLPAAWIIIVGILLFLLLELRRGKKNKSILIIASIFAFELTLYRYFRGIRFPYLTLFAQPFVFLFTAWLFSRLYRYSPFIVITVIIIYMLSSVYAHVYQSEKKITYGRIRNTISEIYKSYPGKKFDIYGCEFTEGGMIAHPVAYFIYRDGRSDINGERIGFCDIKQIEYFPFIPITDYHLRESKLKWYRKTTEHVYKDTVEWWKK